MVRVLFVCHGNICRSPMAEFLFKDYVLKKNRSADFFIASCATSSEEIGNPVHYGTKRILDRLGISCQNKRARKIEQKDYDSFDFIIGMDEYNIRNLKRFFRDDKNKIYLLLKFAGLDRDISDPWYTGDFEKTREDICIGIEAFFQFLVINHYI